MINVFHDQSARLDRLIGLLDGRVAPPRDVPGKQKLLHALMNLHSGELLPPEFFALQDVELTEQSRCRGAVAVSEIPPSPIFPHLRL